LVEVADEEKNLSLQILLRSKVTSSNKSMHQNAKPNFDLIEPGAVLGCVDKPDAMRAICEKCGSGSD
jgi:hypothetical protein